MSNGREDYIAIWRRTHPGVDLQAWCQSMAAVQTIQSDWAYRNGPLRISLEYGGEHGWWL
jgi:hypothetical protein